MKTIANINITKLYEHVLNKTKEPEALSNKETMLCLLSLEHLQNASRKTMILNCTGAFVFGAISLGCILADFPIAMAAGLTTEIYYLNKAFKNIKRSKDYCRLQVLLEMSLTTRYENIIEAYSEISKLIQSVETEDLLQFFEEGGAINE
jgi:hypothetical protein